MREHDHKKYIFSKSSANNGWEPVKYGRISIYPIRICPIWWEKPFAQLEFQVRDYFQSTFTSINEEVFSCQVLIMNFKQMNGLCFQLWSVYNAVNLKRIGWVQSREYRMWNLILNDTKRSAVFWIFYIYAACPIPRCCCLRPESSTRRDKICTARSLAASGR